MKNRYLLLSFIIIIAALLIFSAALFICDAQAKEAGLINYKPISCVDPNEDWKPLSPSEMSKRTIELTFKAAEATAKAVDSLHMSYVSDKLFDVIDLGHKALNIREHFKGKYHVRLEVKGERSILVYQNKF